MKAQHTPEHCPTCGCPCDVSGIGYSPTELYNAAPETAAERDRLKEINGELVQALEKARKLITMAATEVQRPEILRYLSGGYKETIEDACFKDAIGIDAIIQKAKQP